MLARLPKQSCRREVASKSAIREPMLKRYGLSATSSLRKPRCCVVTSTGHSIGTDLPKLAGGGDEFPQPVELMLAALVGCKTATAHYVAKHLWPRPNHRIDRISFIDVVAERDEHGALTLPIDTAAPTTAGLLRVRGSVWVQPRSDAITDEDIIKLGDIVEQRCPVAAMFHGAGCVLELDWRLADKNEDGSLQSE